MSHKKILIFSTAYFPFVGGAEVAIKEVTDRLGHDFEFDLITARLDSKLASEEKIGAVTVFRIGIGMPWVDKFFLPYFGAWKAWRLERQNHYLAFWGVMVSFATGGAFIVNFFKKVPIVLTLQEGDSEKYLKYKWLGLIDLSWKMALNRTDVLTGISTYLLQRAERLGYKGKGVLVPNGVDIKLFENPNQHMREPLTTLITTSRLVEKNGVSDIIQALKMLPETISLKILGIGPLESKLKTEVRDLGLEERVTFLGQVSYQDIPKHLYEADVFLRPSLSEGMGNSFVEAMSAGLPIIGTPVGGITDFLIDGETGLFCQPSDPQSIAHAVEKLIHSTELRRKLVENGQKLAREKYDWDLIAQDMKSRVFESL